MTYIVCGVCADHRPSENRFRGPTSQVNNTTLYFRRRTPPASSLALAKAAGPLACLRIGQQSEVPGRCFPDIEPSPILSPYYAGQG